ECEEPVGFEGGTRLLITLHQKFDANEEKDNKLEANMLGCFRLSALANSAPVKVDVLSAEQRKLVAGAIGKAPELRKLQAFDLFRFSDPELAKLNREINNLWTNWPYPPTTLVLQQREHSRETHLFKRGDRLRPGDEVHPGVPSVLNPLAPDLP